MAAILVGVTGGIAAYKAVDIVSALGKRGHAVRVVMTDSARHFVPEMPLAVLSANPVTTSLWDELDGSVNHIDLAKWADAVVIVPATANIIGKLANGIGDDVLSTVCLAIRPGTSRFVCPAMNTYMWANAAVQRNRQRLEDMGWQVLSPTEGNLACGDEGSGKLPPTGKLVEHIDQRVRNVREGREPLWPLPGVPFDTHGRGAFGTVRKFDRHTGLDLYAPEGAEVVAMLRGRVRHIGPFTGPLVRCDDYPEGSDWWLPTECIAMETNRGVICYGEILVGDKLREWWAKYRHSPMRDRPIIEAGELLGTVKRVLRHDKGTPTAMLHVERYEQWDSRCPVVWRRVSDKPPEGLLDPTPLIHEARLLQ